jgi:hypothetical protein
MFFLTVVDAALIVKSDPLSGHYLCIICVDEKSSLHDDNNRD